MNSLHEETLGYWNERDRYNITKSPLVSKRSTRYRIVTRVSSDIIEYLMGYLTIRSAANLLRARDGGRSISWYNTNDPHRIHQVVLCGSSSYLTNIYMRMLTLNCISKCIDIKLRNDFMDDMNKYGMVISGLMSLKVLFHKSKLPDGNLDICFQIHNIPTYDDINYFIDTVFTKYGFILNSIDKGHGNYNTSYNTSTIYSVWNGRINNHRVSFIGTYLPVQSFLLSYWGTHLMSCISPWLVLSYYPSHAENNEYISPIYYKYHIDEISNDDRDQDRRRYGLDNIKFTYNSIGIRQRSIELLDMIPYVYNTIYFSYIIDKIPIDKKISSVIYICNKISLPKFSIGLRHYEHYGFTCESNMAMLIKNINDKGSYGANCNPEYGSSIKCTELVMECYEYYNLPTPNKVPINNIKLLKMRHDREDYNRLHPSIYDEYDI